MTEPNYEAPNSMFDLSTMRVVLKNVTNLQRIQASFNIPDDEEDLANEVSIYLQKMQKNTENAFEESLALESWRYISRMVGDGSNLLRNAIHAKAVFYNPITCSDYLQGCKELFLKIFQLRLLVKYAELHLILQKMPKMV